jgi:hypothetical protein
MLGVQGFNTSNRFGDSIQGITGSYGTSINNSKKSFPSVEELYDKYQKEKSRQLIHVWYEIYMLLKSAQQFAAHKKEYQDKEVTEDARYVYDATLESFLVHLRVLLGFFEVVKIEIHDNKISYREYAPFNKEKISIDLEYIQKGIKTRLTTEMAHLCTERINNKLAKENWKVSEIEDVMKKKCQYFLDKIRDDFLPKEFLDDLDRWRFLSKLGITLNKS